MKDFLLRIKERFNRPVEPEDDEAMNSYVEVSTGSERDDKGKVNVRRFVIEEFEDIKEILDVLREGSTIALVNIKPLKDKDLVKHVRLLMEILLALVKTMLLLFLILRASIEQVQFLTQQLHYPNNFFYLSFSFPSCIASLSLIFLVKFK